MKVLMINSTFGYGSTGRICDELVSQIQKRGDSAKVLFGRADLGNVDNRDDESIVRIGNDFNLAVHVLYTRIFDRHGLASKTATKEAINQIKQYKPDIIHLHNLHGYYINYEILFSFLKTIDVPIIWTLHDCWAFTGHCSHYSAIACNKWEYQCSHCQQKNDYPKSFCFDRSYQNYLQKKNAFSGVDNMTIVTPSKWLACEVSKSFLGKYDIKTIYNGIDTEVFKYCPSDIKKRYSLETKKIILGVASVWPESKGLKDFIEISRMIDDSWAIVLVGLSKGQEKDLPNNIIAIPRTDSIEMLAQLYSAADVFFNPSIQETMGLVTVEALACGTPVITYNKTAVPEMVGQNCGYVVNANPKEVIEKLDDLFFVKEDCISWARGFRKELFFDDYISLYEEKVNYE